MVSVHVPRLWVGRAVVAIAAAVAVNVGLSSLGIDHDAALVTLLAATTVAAGVLALEAMDAYTRLPWMAPRPDARPDPGEDTRTAMFRHLIEAHETSHEADEAVLWQIAELADRRLRQLHGFRGADDPERAAALLGPHLSDLVSRDRRHRYQPDHRHRRYTVAQLAELVRRIEEL
jgi:hypothetical protein